MTPAERLAALKAIQGALGDAIKDAEHQVEEVRKVTGARSFDTPIGSVTWTKRKPTIGFDDVGLLAWAKENMPHEVEVIERVRDTLKTTLQKRFQIDEWVADAPGPVVIDTATGELIKWAHIKAGSEFATVRLTDEAKDNARAAVLANLDTVTGVLTAGIVTEHGDAA